MVALDGGWREIIIPPSEEGERVLLKPNFELPVRRTRWKLTRCGKLSYFVKEEDNSSWSLIKEFFQGRLDKLLYKRSECNQGNLDQCFAIKAIKGDDTFMGHVVSMVLGASVASMSTEDQEIWLHDLSTPRNFPYNIVKTKTGWRLENEFNQNAKLLYNFNYLVMVVKNESSTDIYFYKTPCCNIGAIR